MLTYKQMDSAERAVTTVLLSKECAVCQRGKPPGRYFCSTCEMRLSMDQRFALQCKMDQKPTAYAAAVDALLGVTQ